MGGEFVDCSIRQTHVEEGNGSIDLLIDYLSIYLLFDYLDPVRMTPVV